MWLKLGLYYEQVHNCWVISVVLLLRELVHTERMPRMPGSSNTVPWDTRRCWDIFHLPKLFAYTVLTFVLLMLLRFFFIKFFKEYYLDEKEVENYIHVYIKKIWLKWCVSKKPKATFPSFHNDGSSLQKLRSHVAADAITGFKEVWSKDKPGIRPRNKNRCTTGSG